MKNSIKSIASKATMLGLSIASVVAIAAPAQAEVKLPNGLTFGSAIFADYTGQTTATGGVTSAVQTTADDAANGFHVSRAYLYLVDKVDDNITARITLDSQTAPKAAPSVFLKHAYIDYKLNDNATVEGGIGGTPWVSFVEKLWGYRYLGSTANIAGKVFADKNGLLSSADGGVSVFGTAGAFNYQVGAYNGEGYGGVANGGGLKIAGRVGYEADMGLGVAAYYDTESKRLGTLNYNPTRTAAVVYFKQPMFTIGGEYLMASDFSGTVAVAGVPTTAWADGKGFSVFANGLVTDNIRLFARYDSATPNTRTAYAAGTGAATLNRTNTVVTGGVSLIMAKGQELTLDYSSANDGAATATTVNTLSVNLMTGF